MSEVRLIDANALEQMAIPCEIHNGALTELCVPLYQIRNAPTVTPDMALFLAYESGKASAERPTGEWIRYRDNPHQPEHIKCSNCGQYWSIADHDKTFEYCFKCGAKMKQEEENE